MFTIIAINQVIWATVSDEKIRLKVVGENEVVEISKGDELFNFYYNKFSENKNAMLKDSLKLV